MSAAQIRRYIPLALLVPIIFAAGFLPVSLPTTEMAIPEGGTKRPVGEISSGVIITEQFPAVARGITSASLLLATYQRANHGVLRITLLTNTDNQWQEQAIREVDTATLTDNAYYTVIFPSPVPTMKGQRVRITLQSDSRPGESVTWWRNPDEQRADTTLIVNGQTLPGSGIYRVSYAPESGRLFSMIGKVWRRSTVFLNPGWQAVLVLGLMILVASVGALTRRLDEA